MRQCGCIYANARNTTAVRKGYEQGGYLKRPCEHHHPERNTTSAQEGTMSNEAKKAPTLVEMLELIKHHAETVESLYSETKEGGIAAALADPVKSQALTGFLMVCVPGVIRQACEIALRELTEDQIIKALGVLTDEAYRLSSKLDSIVGNNTDDLFYHITVSPITKGDAQIYTERANNMAARNEGTLINFPAPEYH